MNGAASQRTVLFVAYGSGHIKMVVPVAKALAMQGEVRPLVLALTTAAAVARAAGLEVVQFKDFVTAADGAALELGRAMMRDMSGPIADPDDTVAYLGLSMSDLIDTLGADAARASYAKFGRQAFLPRRTVERILRQVGPALLVATNSPRAERAAIEAAGSLGIPSVCMVDLFCIDEVKWIGKPGYADRVCVLNESVREFLIGAGRLATEVEVTGNPGFDALRAPAMAALGAQIRRKNDWDGRKVVLWPTQTEPAFHPFNGTPGDPGLPGRALAEVIRWILAREDSVLCVRPRAGDPQPLLPADPRIVLTGQDWPLHPLLHAVDVVATLNSTVGLEGHLAGARLLQVLGSVFDDAMPLERYGVADLAVPVPGIASGLDRLRQMPRREVHVAGQAATDRVVEVIRGFL
ncbi:UDP-glycosyltransferase [Caenimonas soli]|uniref:UDP-glycosyltransferase n=1 Tax=Caenimonas soli TaxID=2735555 RepID=UPI0015582021|nr:UDP-glycosyltransferase [Caenimonas soli]NPC56213.1 UDP-glycosyltransferase [Caenimonas soli]